MTIVHDDVTYAERVEAAHLGQVAMLASAIAGGNRRAVEDLDNPDEFPTLAVDVISNVLMAAHIRGEDHKAIVTQALYHFDLEKLPEIAAPTIDEDEEDDDLYEEERDDYGYDEDADDFDTCQCGCGYTAEETFITSINGGLEIYLSMVGAEANDVAHAGEWNYHVTRWGRPVTRPSRYTSDKPMTHFEVSRVVAEYFTEG
ncbi:hypothetical protein [Nocardia sp. NPDC127526]|uniref:hypothetical protein n=1 Tax=Nocardia sp. NPDC127526 TaxID=3345393 RepID=UPI003638540E